MEIKIFLKNQKIPTNKKWIYFGENHQTLYDLKNYLNKDDYIDFSKDKDEIFKEEFKDYLLWTEKNRLYFKDSIFWWSNEFAGKNNLNSSFYRNICQLNFIYKLIKKATFQSLIIICEDIIIKKALLENLKIRENILLDNIFLLKNIFLPFIILLLNIFKLLIKFTILKFVFLTKGQKLNLGKSINIFHSSGIKLKNNEVNLSYFPGIDFKNKNNNFFLSISKKSFIKKIKDITIYEKNNFIFVERFINFTDLFFIFKEFIKSAKSPDLNFQIWSYFPLFKKLSKITSIINIFDHYENMTSEHLIIGAIKKVSKNTKIFGYHHTFSSRQFLCWNSLPSEWDSDFKPDYIISSGQLSKEFLMSQNCPEKKIIVGPPLRYKELINKKIEKNKIISNLIVVPLSQIKDHSYEIVIKSFEIYKSNKNYNFKICPHPNLEIDKNFYSKYLDKEKNFSLSETSLRDTLNQCQFVISSATGAVYDALILNKIVLNLKSDLNFCDNYLDFLEDFKFLKTLTTGEISDFLTKCNKNQMFFAENLNNFSTASNYFINKLKYDKDFFEILNKQN